MINCLSSSSQENEIRLKVTICPFCVNRQNSNESVRVGLLSCKIDKQ